jgi:hypothetical protein
MMDALLSLVLANALVWLGIGGYVCLLGLRQTALAKRLHNLENLKGTS